MPDLTRRDVLLSAAVAPFIRRRRRAVVWVWLAGGPPAAETFNPPTDATAIPTSVPGVRFGEAFPQLAARADRLAVYRQFGHTLTSHGRASHLMLTGIDDPGIDDGKSQTVPSIGEFLRLAPVVGDGGGRLLPRPESLTDQMTAARQACEAGAAFVLVPVPGWDLHANVADGVRRLGPELDAAVAGFLDRADGILLVLAGEFGRTPWLNRHGGRDHWPAETPLVLAGAVEPGVYDEPMGVRELIEMIV